MTWWKRLPFFYGWVLVAVIFASFGVGYATQLSFSVFYVAILEEFGWSRAATAATYSIFTIVYGMTSLMAGGLVDRFGPRVLLPVGGILVSIGLVLMTGITEIWHLYLAFGVVAATGVSWFGSVPSYTMLSNWFVKKRGLAIGVAASGIGVGLMLLVPFLQSIISTSGWRSAYLVLAVMVLAVIPTLNFIFQRHRPQDLGLLPDGESSRDGPALSHREKVRRDILVVDKEWASRDWTLGSAARTGRFWLLFFARGLELGALQVFLVHQAAFFVDAGYDKMVAATVVGMVGIVGSGAKILWGSLSDRIGREMTFTLAMLCGTLGVGIALSVQTGSPSWLPFAYALVYGLCYGVSGVLLPALAADIFHSRSFGSILGGIYIGAGAGAGAGAFLAGYVFDLTGSYTMAFLTVLPTMWVACLLYWLAAPRKVRLVGGKARRLLGVKGF